jgi:protein phosphatase 1 regulatory subunit 11
MRQREETPTSGSQTITSTPVGEEAVREESPVVLHLHAVPNTDERRVTWDEEVVDNENMGKKSSKGTSPLETMLIVVCCIYHKPRQFGESSSDESSSSSSDESDSDNEGPSRRPVHDHEHPNGDEPCPRHAKSRRVEKRKRKPSPNAYERQPQTNKKKDDNVKPMTNGSGY